jgi:hypothetical protein
MALTILAKQHKEYKEDKEDKDIKYSRQMNIKKQV